MEKWIPKTEKKKRASKPKVKTGCITCKIRHVKCDETKPECTKCTSTGRKCDGYPEPVQQKAKSPSNEGTKALSQPERQLQVVIGSAKERRAVEFFFHRTAPQLSGFFSGSFWSSCVLQLSLVEPAIRYAMVAVSAMYEDESLIGISPCAGTDSHQAFALESYNRAIHSVIKSADANPESIRVPVMAAIIFICLEFLRGNVDAALKHIESGINMLRTWRKKNNSSQTSTIPSGLLSEAAFIETELVPMFASLNLLYSLFGKPSLELYSTNTATETYFTPQKLAITINDARFQLLDLVNAITKFIQSVGESRYKTEISIDLIGEQVRLRCIMDEWSANFGILLERVSAVQSEHEKRGTNLLQAIALTLDVWLSVALCPNETAWDMYKDDYAEIVRLSETVVADGVCFPDEVPKRFSFEMGIIPPLHFVAWKCRWPHIRRKALSLLWASPRRECLFDSHRSYVVFSNIMYVEEEYLGLAKGEVPLEHVLPPEEVRIHQVDVPPASPMATGSPINLVSKPHGIAGPWHSRTVYMDLGRIEFDKSISTYPWLEVVETIPSVVDEAEQLYPSQELAPGARPPVNNFSVSGLEASLSIGRFKPYESSEADFTRRKAIFSSQQPIGTPERLGGLGGSVFNGGNRFREGQPTASYPRNDSN